MKQTMANRTKKTEVSERLHLTFPKDLIREPVLSILAKKFDVVFNIRGSTVTSEMALVELELKGEQKEVTKSIAWLKTKGVTVESLPRNVVDID